MTQLVDRVTNTITKNLIEGGLIVISYSCTFLGNYRAGLQVASVIPLSMPFAFGMMRVWCKWKPDEPRSYRLRIDCGWGGSSILDEAVCHHRSHERPIEVADTGRNQEVFDSASKIRNSAAFGEIIIMIVYIPLFNLVGRR